MLLMFSQIFRFDAIFTGSSRFVPFYLFFIITALFLVQAQRKLNIISVLTFCVLVIFLITQQLSIQHSSIISTNKANVVRDIISIIYFSGTLYLIYFFTQRTKLKSDTVLKTYVNIAIITLLLETFLRLFYPSLGVNDQDLTNYQGFSYQNLDAFYYFKYGSIMFYDSNYTGLFALSILLTVIYLRNIYGLNKFLYWGYFIPIIITIIILSFSRSAIITAVFILLMSLAKKSLSKLLFIAAIGCVSVFILYTADISDKSLASKFEIYSSLTNIYDYSLIDVLFGGGYFAGSFWYSPNQYAYAHSHFPLLLGQVGILGIFAYCVALAYLSLRYALSHMFVLAFLISGLSLADPLEPYFFAPLMFILGSIRKETNENTDPMS